jgi:hypothetical protein
MVGWHALPPRRVSMWRHEIVPTPLYGEGMPPVAGAFVH